MHNLSLNVVHTCFKTGDIFKHKEHQPKLLHSNVVYKLTCSCDSVYIGQTRRNLCACLDDHNPTANSNQQSDVAKHLLENPTHFINLMNQKFYVSTYNSKELLIKKTLLIYQLQLDINVDISSFLQYVFNN